MNFHCGFDYRSTMYAYSAMFVEKSDVTHVCGCVGVCVWGGGGLLRRKDRFASNV